MARYKRSVICILLPLLLLVLSACSGFNLVDSNFRPKGKTLAVISGLDNDPNMLAAQHMTDALRKNSRFQVMSQKQVAQSVSNYPQKIKGPYKSSYFQIDTDYSNTDIKKIRQIQQQLGVDYLYVMWTPSATITNDKIYTYNIITQLFEGPSSKEVGNGMFGATAGKTDCCLVPKPDDKDKANAIKDTTEYVAKQIAEKTGMQK
jgi:hypothetical protein